MFIKMILEKIRQFLFGIFLLVIIVAGILYVTSGENAFMQNIQETVKNAGIWAPVIFIGLYILLTIFIPSTPLMALSGILFGFKYGIIYTLIGGIISSLILFLLTKKLGSNFAEKILQHKIFEKIKKYNKRIEDDGTLELIILRIVPIMPFNALNIIMGLSGMKTYNYIIGTVIGLIPSHIVSVYLGNFLGKTL
jgi:uncharacterized membrane protein YdjX (TVP38/TMEM64 family)